MAGHRERHDQHLPAEMTVRIGYENGVPILLACKTPAAPWTRDEVEFVRTWWRAVYAEHGVRAAVEEQAAG